MKHLLFIFLLVSTSLVAQSKYLTKSGTLTFEASVPAFEEVKATNNSVTAILNADNGEFAALALIKGFRFKNALMEEHFNENYIESDDYPKATFKGKLTKFSIDNLNEEAIVFPITGELSLHGETKTFNEISTNIALKDGLIIITGEFVANPEDFKIKIPNIVSNKVAENVNVYFEFKLKKK